MSELALQLIAENKKTKSPVLDLGNCGLTELPEEVLECVWLEELILSTKWIEYDIEKNKLKDKSQESQNKGKENNISFLPLNISRLHSLKKLVIAGSYNSKWDFADLLPISGLVNLQQLYCDFTRVSELSQIASLVNLEKLSCASIDIISLAKIDELVNLQQLICHNTHIDDLSQLEHLVNLQFLSLSNTLVADLSPIANLVNLQTLSCHNTKVTNLSPIANLVNLQTLDCSYTEVDDLSPITNLVNLHGLGCSFTKVIDLSPIVNLTNLQILLLSNTRVDDISPLVNLISLEQIYVDSTHISDLSPLTNLSRLRQLNCMYTLVYDLLPILHLIKQGLMVCYKMAVLEDGDWINVNHCPLISPPPEIAVQGNAAILNYFNERETQGKEKIKEAKLLILGEGGAGKTTLARKVLRGFSEHMPGEQDSTHGIEIQDYSFPCTEGRDFNMHVWDFGGQEIYHATHQFFLTKRSLYVLVADVRKEDTNFDYWLHVVELLSDNSPVLIVQNRRGGRIKDIDLAGLRGRFKNLIGFIPLDLSKDEIEFNELLREIRTNIQKLPHTNEEWPTTWARIRSELESLKQSGNQYITADHYLGICEKYGLDELRAMHLSQFLHDFGVFLHFQDDVLLKRTVFLNNDWVTKGVYSVLDDLKVIESKGYFTASDARNIWKNEAYRQMGDELLQLMNKFEVCYRLPEGAVESYLVPNLLSAQSPEIEWEDADNLQLRYDYDFMPKGLLSRLIVRLHRYLPNPQQEAWRSGAVFHRQGAKVKLVETYGFKNLQLRAMGSEAKVLVTLISEEIDHLNASYQGLKVQKLVPCNCRICKTAQEPNFYKYENLMRRKEQGKTTVECEISFDNVNVLRLIDDVFVTTFFMEQPKKVFISYSKSDKTYLEQLKKHITPLQKQGLLQTWDDTELIPGEEWDASIRRELNAADIIILLVSSDLMATDYVWNIEMKEAVERHERGQATVIPIILRPSLWQDAPFAHLNAIPEKGKAISTWANPDEAWAQVGEKIKQIAKRKKI